MPPRILGRSKLVPGALDVEDEEGNVFQVDPDTPAVRELGYGDYEDEERLGGMSASEPMANFENDVMAQASRRPSNQLSSVPDLPAPDARARDFAERSVVKDLGFAPGQEQGQPDSAMQQSMDRTFVPWQQQSTPGAQSMDDRVAPGVPTYQEYAQQLFTPRPAVAGGPRVKEVFEQKTFAPLPPEVEAEQKAAEQEGRASREEELQALDALALERHIQGTKQADLAREQANANQEWAQRYAANMDEKYQEIERMVNDVRSYKIDPAKMWKSEGARKTFLISHIISTIAHGLQGEASPLTALLDDMTDREIEKQKLEIEKMRGDIEEGRNLFGDMRVKYGEDRAARLATEIQLREAAALEASSILDSMEGKVDTTKARVTLADWGQQIVDKKVEFARLTGGIKTRQEMRVSGGPGSPGGVKAPTAQQMAMLKWLQEQAQSGGLSESDKKLVVQLSDKVRDSGIDQFWSAHKQLMAVMPKYGNIDGVGVFQWAARGIPVSGNFVDFITSDQGLKVRAAANLLASSFTRGQIGSQQTWNELTRIKQIFAGGESINEQQFRYGVDFLTKLTQGTTSNIAGGFDEAIHDAYWRNRQKNAARLQGIGNTRGGVSFAGGPAE